MKSLKLLFLLMILMGCKKNTFADKIELIFPAEVEMKIQDFNEDMDELGSNLIYIGRTNKQIDVKYHLSGFASPEPIGRPNESTLDYEKRIKTITDSLNNLTKSYFRTEKIKTYIQEKEYIIDSLTDSKLGTITSDFPYDYLSNKNLQIIVKENTTIPLYKKIMGTTEVKTYKAFPVFIKNISDKILPIPYPSGVQFYFQNDEKKFQYLKNSNYMICGTGQDARYFELKPNEVLIYAYPYFKKGVKRRAKVKFYEALSKEFEVSIDEKIILNQRDKFFLY